MKIIEKIQKLRERMQTAKIDAFVVYSADPHMSEYLPLHWEERKWLTGFTGSAGMVVFTAESAGLWTDSRYFVQATAELEGTGITLMKQGVAGVPTYEQWLLDQLKENSIVAVNGQCTAYDDWENLQNSLIKKKITLVDNPLLAELWENRPKNDSNSIFIHPLVYAGQSVEDKLAIVREQMKTKNVNLHIVSSLDDIAWLTNLRGDDVAFNPVFLSYLLIDAENATLFADEAKCTDEVRSYLTEVGINLKSYDTIFEYLRGLENQKILIDAHSNQRLIEHLKANNTFVFDAPPSRLLKSVKNTTEVAGVKKAMLKDGVAMVHFLYWLKKNIGEEPMNEVSVSEKLLYFRQQQSHFVGASFNTIAGYNSNGAIVHYAPKLKTAKEIRKEGVLLLDSGGQYLEGTTDITRTIPLGEVSSEFKKDYTLVLKGMIALSKTSFPVGTRGCNIDAIARQPLWENNRNYGHGTGHGVGCFLNVHEGPQNIRQELRDQVLLAGMISSNEPGLYRENEYGIRHENLVLCVEKETTEFGVFLGFETLTLCPFFTETIDTTLFSKDELIWFNEYQQKVKESLLPFLDEEHSEWLTAMCKPIA